MSPNVHTKPSFADDVKRFQGVAGQAREARVISQKTLDDIVADPFLSPDDVSGGQKLVASLQKQLAAAQALLAAAEQVFVSQGPENAIGHTLYKDRNTTFEPTGLAGQRLPTDPAESKATPPVGYFKRFLSTLLG